LSTKPDITDLEWKNNTLQLRDLRGQDIVFPLEIGNIEHGPRFCGTFDQLAGGAPRPRPGWLSNCPALRLCPPTSRSIPAALRPWTGARCACSTTGPRNGGAKPPPPPPPSPTYILVAAGKLLLAICSVFCESHGRLSGRRMGDPVSLALLGFRHVHVRHPDSTSTQH
jgi:hypothetical protein